MKDFECPACGEMIPADSKYCDMCGVELLECVNCGTPGTGTFCAECGSPMVARKTGEKASAPKPVKESVKEQVGAGGDGHVTGGADRKKIVLRSRDSKIEIVPADRAVIGRGEGPYKDILADFGRISRRHGQFMKRGRSWYILDFGSTNGTLVNDDELAADSPVKFAPGDVVDIGTYVFDVLEQ